VALDHTTLRGFECADPVIATQAETQGHVAANYIPVSIKSNIIIRTIVPFHNQDLGNTLGNTWMGPYNGWYATCDKLFDGYTSLLNCAGAIPSGMSRRIYLCVSMISNGVGAHHEFDIIRTDTSAEIMPSESFTVVNTGTDYANRAFWRSTAFTSTDTHPWQIRHYWFDGYNLRIAVIFFIVEDYYA